MLRAVEERIALIAEVERNQRALRSGLGWLKPPQIRNAIADFKTWEEEMSGCG